MNDFDQNQEPPLDQPLQNVSEWRHTYILHKSFFEMLQFAWYSKEKSEANAMPVLKGTHFFFSTATSLCIRPASEVPSPVLRIPLGDKTDFLHVKSRLVYDYHRKGGNDLPKDVDKKVEWEAWSGLAYAGHHPFPQQSFLACIVFFGSRCIQQCREQ